MITAQEAREMYGDICTKSLARKIERIEAEVRRTVSKGKTEVWLRYLDGKDVVRLHRDGYSFRMTWYARLFGGCIVSWEGRK